MPVKSHIKMAAASTQAFPKLMKSKHLNFIVFFSSKNNGIVVLRGDEICQFNVGYHSSEWVMDMFEDIPLGTTVTLEQV